MSSTRRRIRFAGLCPYSESLASVVDMLTSMASTNVSLVTRLYCSPTRCFLGSGSPPSIGGGREMAGTTADAILIFYPSNCSSDAVDIYDGRRN